MRASRSWSIIQACTLRPYPAVQLHPVVVLRVGGEDRALESVRRQRQVVLVDVPDVLAEHRLVVGNGLVGVPDQTVEHRAECPLRRHPVPAGERRHRPHGALRTARGDDVVEVRRRRGDVPRVVAVDGHLEPGELGLGEQEAVVGRVEHRLRVEGGGRTVREHGRLVGPGRCEVLLVDEAREHPAALVQAVVASAEAEEAVLGAGSRRCLEGVADHGDAVGGHRVDPDAYGVLALRPDPDHELAAAGVVGGEGEHEVGAVVLDLHDVLGGVPGPAAGAGLEVADPLAGGRAGPASRCRPGTTAVRRAWACPGCRCRD